MSNELMCYECKGHGYIYEPNTPRKISWSVNTPRKKCRLCKGKGYVTGNSLFDIALQKKIKN
jgi:DnaJ-class molecular chaperone